MAGNDIGVTFIPSQANQQAQGPSQGSLEGDLSRGGSSDLGQAFKILSLQLPRVVSPVAPVSPDLLTPGVGRTAPPTAMKPPAGNVPINGQPNVTQPPAAVDPMAAVFAALLRSLSGGSAAPVGTAGGSLTDLLGGMTGAGRPAVRLPQTNTPALGSTIPSGVTNEFPGAANATIAGGGGSPIETSSAPSAPPSQDYQSWAGSY